MIKLRKVYFPYLKWLILFVLLCFPPLPAQAGLSEYAYLNNDTDDTVKASTFRKALKNAARCARSSVDELLIGAAEVMITKSLSADTVTSFLQDVALECVNAKKAADFLKAKKIKNASQIKRSVYLERGVANYGRKGSLSGLARAERLKAGKKLGGHRNIAVVEYTLNGKKMKPMVVVSSGTGKTIGHSEQKIIKALNKKKGKVKVKRLYSERRPCSSGPKSCYDKITNDSRFKEATVEYTFDHTSDSQKKAFGDLVEKGLPMPEKLDNPFKSLTRGLNLPF